MTLSLKSCYDADSLLGFSEAHLKMVDQSHFSMITKVMTKLIKCYSGLLVIFILLSFCYSLLRLSFWAHHRSMSMRHTYFSAAH